MAWVTRTLQRFRNGSARARTGFVGEHVPNIPESLKVPNVESASQHLHGRALCADDVAANDALHELQVQRSPHDQPLVPVDESLREVENVRVRLSIPLDLAQ